MELLETARHALSPSSSCPFLSPRRERRCATVKRASSAGAVLHQLQRLSAEGDGAQERVRDGAPHPRSHPPTPPSPDEDRASVLLFRLPADRDRALAGRLLARAACRAALKMGVGAGAISASPVGATSTATAAPALPPTSDDPLSPRVARTKGRKPYLSAPRPCRLAAPNWNFNGSHDGEGRGGEGERRRFGPDKVSPNVSPSPDPPHQPPSPPGAWAIIAAEPRSLVGADVVDTRRHLRAAMAKEEGEGGSRCRGAAAATAALRVRFGDSLTDREWGRVRGGGEEGEGPTDAGVDNDDAARSVALRFSAIWALKVGSSPGRRR